MGLLRSNIHCNIRKDIITSSLIFNIVRPRGLWELSSIAEVLVYPLKLLIKAWINVYVLPKAIYRNN